MQREGTPSVAGSSSTATARSAPRSPSASDARSNRAASASPPCRTRACKHYSPCRPPSFCARCAWPRRKGLCTAAPRLSYFLPGKSGGPGRFMPRQECPASRVSSPQAIAGLPITGPAPLECVLFLGITVKRMPSQAKDSSKHRDDSRSFAVLRNGPVFPRENNAIHNFSTGPMEYHATS